MDKNDLLISWSEERVLQWLRLPTLKLGDYAATFEEEGVSGALLMELTEENLADMGMSNSFHVKKLLLALKPYKEAVEAHNKSTAPDPQVGLTLNVENDLLTSGESLINVMFPNLSPPSAQPTSATAEQSTSYPTRQLRPQVVMVQNDVRVKPSSKRPRTPSASPTSVTETWPKELTVSLLTQAPFNWYWTKGVSNSKVDDSYYYVTKYREDGTKYSPIGVYNNLERNVTYFCTEDAIFDEAIRLYGRDKYVKIEKSNKKFRAI